MARVERREKAMPVQRSINKVLGELLSPDWQAPFVNCVREPMCAKEVRMFEEDVEMARRKLKLISGGFFCSLHDNDGALNVLRT